MSILNNVFNFQSSSQNTCFRVLFASSSLGNKVAEAHSKHYFALTTSVSVCVSVSGCLIPVLFFLLLLPLSHQVQVVTPKECPGAGHSYPGSKVGAIYIISNNM